MTTKSTVRLSAVALGAVLIGSPVAARAAEATPATQADATAQQFRDQAARYRAMGAVGYKTGLVQRADADAAKYAALAEQLRAPAVQVPRSPDAERYARLAEQYRRLGGTGYKTGLVQWAETQARKFEATGTAGTTTEQPAVACLPNKPVLMLACTD
jgi:hypothetical protein